MEPAEGYRPGRRATVTITVAQTDTASALGSGDVAALASARVLEVAEKAAVNALAGCLPEGMTSVGAWAELDHLLPSPVGATVTAEAVLVGVHGRRLEFSVSLRHDDGEEVAHVRQRRSLTDRAGFAQAP